MIKNYYKILDVKSDATIEEIKKAYRKLALKCHPDVNKDVNAHNMFIEINEAYLILSDSEARKKYDRAYRSYFIRQPETADLITDYEEERYEDDDLNNWSKNARKQSEKYASMSYEKFSKMVKEIVKETSIQGITAILYAVSGILGANGFFAIIVGMRDSKPEKIVIAIIFILLSIVGFSITSKKYSK